MLSEKSPQNSGCFTDTLLRYLHIFSSFAIMDETFNYSDILDNILQYLFLFPIAFIPVLLITDHFYF